MNINNKIKLLKKELNKISDISIRTDGEKLHRYISRGTFK